MRKLLLAALLSAFAALATPIATVKIVGIPANDPVIGNPGVYSSPYTLSINGHNYTALCIDFNDESKVGTSWSAYLSQDGVDVANTYNPSKLIAYEQEAYLYTLITQPGISSQTKVDLQEAAWDLMNPSYYGSNKTYAPDAAALSYVSAAQNNYKTVDFTKFLIVSSVDYSCGREQEFLVATPEPASCALFGFGLLVAGGYRFLSRKRAS